MIFFWNNNLPTILRSSWLNLICLNELVSLVFVTKSISTEGVLVTVQSRTTSIARRPTVLLSFQLICWSQSEEWESLRRPWPSLLLESSHTCNFRFNNIVIEIIISTYSFSVIPNDVTFLFRLLSNHYQWRGLALKILNSVWWTKQIK